MPSVLPARCHGSRSRKVVKDAAARACRGSPSTRSTTLAHLVAHGCSAPSVPFPNCRHPCRAVASTIRKQRDTSRVNGLVRRCSRNCRRQTVPQRWPAIARRHTCRGYGGIGTSRYAEKRHLKLGVAAQDHRFFSSLAKPRPEAGALAHRCQCCLAALCSAVNHLASKSPREPGNLAPRRPVLVPPAVPMVRR